MLCSCGLNNLEQLGDLIPEEGWNIVEDADAHEEIFGKVALPFAGGPKKTAYAGNIGLGVQTMVNLDTTLNIRFIAAIDLDEGDLADTTAVWTRVIYEDGGDLFQAAETFEAAKAYTSLNNGGTPYSISDFNADHGGASYDFFVVYTLLNAPASAADYLMTTYVTVDTKKSDAIVSTIDGDTKFTMDVSLLDSSGTFGIKKSGSTFTKVTPTTVDSGDNYASYSALALGAGEAFITVRYVKDASLNLYGYTNMLSGGNNMAGYFRRDGSSNFSVSAFDTTTNIYVSRNESTRGYIYLSDGAGGGGGGDYEYVSGYMYFKATLASWFDNDPVIYLDYSQASGDDEHYAWEKMVDEDGDGIYVTENKVTFSPWKSYLFVAMKSADPSWSNYWRQTADQHMWDTGARGSNLFDATAVGGDGKYTGSWSVHHE